ncbi:citrulline utilization hydrolase CtlX [Pedobacter metabolipauper]|uniref:Amidinotransferase n=1 Tax=Pedobacter metabolipauper TaxID=425513 RepID=A0A4R6SY47_9SPHI|nr:arginine deiminase-related protein [Pedobacter metabolipauper]TDQ11474.1 hypothetical protein ATK78_0596 [Pedobacter metabolipauper]
MQTTNHILMIRPVDFKFNEQTAGNNKFQQASAQTGVQNLALKEFDDFVSLLKSNGVDVTVVDDTLQPETPDSIFPNNWVSFHDNGEVILYPMFSENRRAERRTDILETLRRDFSITEITDMSTYEQDNIYLEGTGSLVLDRDHKIAYACLSLRTDEKLLTEFCIRTGYTAVMFHAVDEKGFPIYHTNVMMCVGEKFAVICPDCINNPIEREQALQSLRNTGKEIIDISYDQMNHFAGNMLQVKNDKGEALLVMSEQAFNVLTADQIETLGKYCKLVYSSLNTIETNGGGSARCMLAEIHLPKA